MERLTDESCICMNCDGIAHCKTDCLQKRMYDKLKHYADLEQGRLRVLDIKDIHPCMNCGVGWGSASSAGVTTCEETCIRLKAYNEMYSTQKELQKEKDMLKDAKREEDNYG